MMPGPERPKLWVTGNVTAPTGAWAVALERGPLQESHPAVQQVLVRAAPPRGASPQAPERHELRASFPYEQEIGAVTVRCGRDVIATIGSIEKAY